MIITVGGIKGGTGKSTILSHLATLAASDGARVLIVDADSQHSLLSWSDARNERTETLPQITTVAMRGGHIGTEIRKLSVDYDCVFVDTDGQDGGSQRSALLAAHKFLTTFGPRAQDVWTADQVAALVKGAKAVNTELTAFSVLNRCDTRGGRQNAEAEGCLSEYADAIPLLPIRLGERKAIAMSFEEGLGLVEQPRRDVKALDELTALWTLLKKGS